MLDTTTLNASEAASAVRPTGCQGQEAATRLIAWPRVGPPVPAPVRECRLCCLASSGYMAAESLTQAANAGRKILTADLPARGLMRMFG